MTLSINTPVIWEMQINQWPCSKILLQGKVWKGQKLLAYLYSHQWGFAQHCWLFRLSVALSALSSCRPGAMSSYQAWAKHWALTPLLLRGSRGFKFQVELHRNITKNKTKFSFTEFLYPTEHFFGLGQHLKCYGLQGMEISQFSDVITWYHLWCSNTSSRKCQ